MPSACCSWERTTRHGSALRTGGKSIRRAGPVLFGVRLAKLNQTLSGDIDERYRDLAVSIIEQAIEDFRHGGDARRWECIRFFKSGWFVTLSGGIDGTILYDRLMEREMRVAKSKRRAVERFRSKHDGA